MKQTSRLFIGMDVHKATIFISVAEVGRSGPVRAATFRIADVASIQRFSASQKLPFRPQFQPAMNYKPSPGIWVFMGVHMVDVLARHSPDHARGPQPDRGG